MATGVECCDLIIAEYADTGTPDTGAGSEYLRSRYRRLVVCRGVHYIANSRDRQMPYRYDGHRFYMDGDGFAMTIRPERGYTVYTKVYTGLLAGLYRVIAVCDTYVQLRVQLGDQVSKYVWTRDAIYYYTGARWYLYNLRPPNIWDSPSQADVDTVITSATEPHQCGRNVIRAYRSYATPILSMEMNCGILPEPSWTWYYRLGVPLPPGLTF